MYNSENMPRASSLTGHEARAPLSGEVCVVTLKGTVVGMPGLARVVRMGVCSLMAVVALTVAPGV